MMRNPGPCSIEGCANLEHSRGWCRKHYMRWWEHGDPNFAHFVPAAAGEPRAFIDSLPTDGEGCVTWPYAKNNAGYAQINLGKSNRKALVSRVVCERVNGPPPSPLHHAAHSCGKGHEACIAPWHLVWKTPAENSADQDLHGTRSRGEHHALKLSEANVLAIRAQAGSRSQSKIAKEFGVSQSMVSMIVSRQVWSHLP